MKDETMMILKMIESGKITADDAVKLINALKSDGKSTTEKIDSVKKKVTKFAKEAEPKVKAAANVIVEKSTELGSNFKKKVEEKINESKIKEKAEDIIDDVIDVDDDDFFDEGENDVLNEDEE